MKDDRVADIIVLLQWLWFTEDNPVAQKAIDAYEMSLVFGVITSKDNLNMMEI